MFDRSKLTGVHPDLVRVVLRAADACPQPFAVVCGVRSVADEIKAIREGRSALRNPYRCRHVPTVDKAHPALGPVSHAVDLVPIVNGKPLWSWPHIYPIARAMKAAAQAEHVTIEWGGDWKTFKDGPHYQLPWNLYP